MNMFKKHDNDSLRGVPFPSVEIDLTIINTSSLPKSLFENDDGNRQRSRSCIR